MRHWKTLLPLTLYLLAGTPLAKPQEPQILFLAPSGQVAEKVLAKVRKLFPSAVLVRSTDGGVHPHLPVPHSVKPRLGLGRVDSEGRLHSLTWSTDCSDPSAAKKELEMHQASLVSGPRISEVRLSSIGPFRAGEKLRLAVKATPGGRLTYRVGNGAEHQMTEKSLGVFSSEHRARAEEVGYLPLHITLQTSKGQVFKQTQELVFLGLEGPSVDRVDYTGRSTWILHGSAPANSRVKGTLEITGHGKRTVEARADGRGRFRFQVSLNPRVEQVHALVQLAALTAAGESSFHQQTVNLRVGGHLHPSN